VGEGRRGGFFWGPRIRGMPIRKSMLPIASMARSKNMMTPALKKNPPTACAEGYSNFLGVGEPEG